MNPWVTGVRVHHALRLSRVCWALAAVFALLSLAVLLFIPELSVLSEPDGTKYFYIDRQVDLPTGDSAFFSDYSLLPLCGGIAGCSMFYIMTGAWLRGARRTSRFRQQPPPLFRSMLKADSR